MAESGPLPRPRAQLHGNLRPRLLHLEMVRKTLRKVVF